MKPNELEYLMAICLSEAEKAYRREEVPIGAVIVNETGKILAKSHNDKEKKSNPCGHAEILALQKASKIKGDWRLTGCTLVVSLEPCPMCLAAALQSRIKRIVFGAYDSKGGSLSLGYCLYKDSRFNHSFAVTGGICHYESSRILSQFFREKRMNYKRKF